MADYSENNRRLARNTLLLYCRMFLLMLIGLYTSRMVLGALGEADYGIYGVVGGIVVMFTVFTTSISQAISRYITIELGREDTLKLKKVFSTAVVMQILFCLFVLILTETLGMWYLRNVADIPDGRMGAAVFVLQGSMGVLMVNLLSVPFNATIVAHERMDAFAWISILEAALKLIVAILIAGSGSDRLKLYAMLMLAVALVVRLAYGVYCKRNFEETRGPLCLDGRCLREMTGFAGWNVLGSGAYLFNTQGVNQLSNPFFGVGVNAARLVASQIEGIVKQFVSSFLTALNPQITKSYASDDREYCFSLVGKGVKYSVLMMLAFALPLFIEAPGLLRLWLKAVPAHSVTFVRLTLFCLIADMAFNPLLTLIQADGRIKRYYIISSAISILVFAFSWVAFALGAQAYVSYVIFIAVYLVVDVVKLLTVKRLSDFPVLKFLKDSVLPILLVGIISSLIPVLCHFSMSREVPRIILVVLFSWMSLASSAWFLVIEDSEHRFLLDKLGRFLPDSFYLKRRYRLSTGKPLDLSSPKGFNAKLQWLKLHDHNDSYHMMADKASVKKLVKDRIAVIPTIGKWDCPEQIDFDSLPDQFVLKCTHDSGSAIICRDKAAFDRDKALRSLTRALEFKYWRRDREWAYKGIRPAVIAEPFMGENIPDYKFFCFSGEPKFMFIATERSSKTEETKFDFFDMDFRHIDVRNGHPNAPVPPSRPANWEKMKSLAALLSKDIPHVRVDFYEIDGEVFFGEYTFYHWSGLMPFDPESFDELAGSYLELPRE